MCYKLPQVTVYLFVLLYTSMFISYSVFISPQVDMFNKNCVCYGHRPKFPAMFERKQKNKKKNIFECFSIQLSIF